MKPKKISKILLKRLALYLNHLQSLPEDTTNVSARSIANALDLGEVSVRKDLARVSGGGRCKTGHMRDRLIQDIEHFLDFGDTTNAVVIGSGKLGQALLEYYGFEQVGIKLMAGFDIHSGVTCSEKGAQIYPIGQMAPYCKTHNIKIGIITVPKEAAQEVCDLLVSCGIRGIWNFAPTHLKVPEDVVVRNESVEISLAALRVELRNREESAEYPTQYAQ